jgi:hypothetical protein
MAPIRTYQDTKSENWVQWSIVTQGSALLQPNDVVVLSLRHERLLRLTQLPFLWHGPDIIFGVFGDVQVHGGHASGNSLVDLCLKATSYI